MDPMKWTRPRTRTYESDCNSAADFLMHRMTIFCRSIEANRRDPNTRFDVEPHNKEAQREEDGWFAAQVTMPKTSPLYLDRVFRPHYSSPSGMFLSTRDFQRLPGFMLFMSERLGSEWTLMNDPKYTGIHKESGFYERLARAIYGNPLQDLRCPHDFDIRSEYGCEQCAEMHAMLQHFNWPHELTAGGVRPFYAVRPYGKKGQRQFGCPDMEPTFRSAREVCRYWEPQLGIGEAAALRKVRLAPEEFIEGPRGAQTQLLMNIPEQEDSTKGAAPWFLLGLYYAFYVVEYNGRRDMFFDDPKFLTPSQKEHGRNYSSHEKILHGCMEFAYRDWRNPAVLNGEIIANKVPDDKPLNKHVIFPFYRRFDLKELGTNGLLPLETCPGLFDHQHVMRWLDRFIDQAVHNQSSPHVLPCGCVEEYGHDCGPISILASILSLQTPYTDPEVARRLLAKIWSIVTMLGGRMCVYSFSVLLSLVLTQLGREWLSPFTFSYKDYIFRDIEITDRVIREAARVAMRRSGRVRRATHLDTHDAKRIRLEEERSVRGLNLDDEMPVDDAGPYSTQFETPSTAIE